MTTANGRTSSFDIDPLFLERWSPRAFDGKPISQVELETILEAGRWAPSSFNLQPWRFVYAHRDTPAWDRLFSLLIPFNQGWVKTASVLMFVVSQSHSVPAGKDKPVQSYSHSFDAGAAWGSMALQAIRMGLHAHGMTGFNAEESYKVLNVPEGFRVEAAVAIGRKGDPAVLPESLAAREMPSDRRPLSETMMEGGFPQA